MSKIMDYLLEEAETKFDGDFEKAQEHFEKERHLAELEWEKEKIEKDIAKLEIELGKREPTPKIDFLSGFPEPSQKPSQKYTDDPDRAYEEWVDARVERGEF